MNWIMQRISCWKSKEQDNMKQLFILLAMIKMKTIMAASNRLVNLRILCGCLLVFFSSLCVHANYMEIELALNDLLSEKANVEIENVDSLKISGVIHSEDISFIQENLSSTETKKAKLSYLDLSGVENYANKYSFYWYRTLNFPESFGNNLTVSVLKLPKINIGAGSFGKNPYLTTLELAPDTEIGGGCFCDCDSLESVFIPRGCVFTHLTSDVAFTCFLGKNFKSFNVDAANNLYRSVDGLLLDKDGKTLLAVPMGLKRVKVPDSVEVIAKNAFPENNQNIETILFGKNITTIEDCPFDNKPRLARIIVQLPSPVNIPKCNQSHFYSKYFFDKGELYVPVGASRHYEEASGWKNIPKIIEYSPDKLNEIFEEDAYDETYGYEYDFKIDNIYYKITSFEDNTVGVINGNIPYVGSIKIPDEITYRNRTLSVTSIISMNNGDISNLTIPNTVTSIGGLSGNSFETIILPNSLLELRDRVFANCSNLNGIDIPDVISTIPIGAFENCTKLEYVNWRPRISATIEQRAFFECISLKSFTFTSNMRSLGGPIFKPNNAPSFKNCPLDSLTFEDGCRIHMESSGEFNGNHTQKLYLGQLYWGYSSCAVFPKLEELIIGDNITTVIYSYDNAAYRYPSLYGLKKMTIGAKVSKIESFSSEEVWVRNIVPPTVNGTLSNDVYLNSKLYVPRGTIKVYQEAPVWKNFWNIEEYDCNTSSEEQIVTDVNKFPIGIYDLNGVKHNNLTNGVNIIRYSDGTVEKILK